MPAAHEQELIKEIKATNPDAFRVLVQSQTRMAYDIAYTILGDHNDADDVTQEAFVNVHRSLARFREESDFNTSLCRIVKNCALNRRKQ